MDFDVYDNIYTYEKMHPTIKHYPESNLKIKQVAITVQGAFWFETDFDKEEHNININRQYLHLHKGVQSLSKMQFKKEPYYIDMQKIIYNPKNRCIEIYDPKAFWPWKKPVFTKKAKYYGVDMPVKKIKTLGNWFFDYNNQKISAILNYYPGYPDFKYSASELDSS